VIDPVGSAAPAGSGSAADRLTRLLFRSTFVFWARFVARAAELGLTHAGVERRTQLMELLARAPESVQALDPHAIERLADGLERILAAELDLGPDGRDAGAAGSSQDSTHG